MTFKFITAVEASILFNFENRTISHSKVSGYCFKKQNSKSEFCSKYNTSYFVEQCWIAIIIMYYVTYYALTIL